jgi:hypothetical protein
MSKYEKFTVKKIKPLRWTFRFQNKLPALRELFKNKMAAEH